MKNRLNGNARLKRDIGLFSATILVIANMVGTGIFTTSGFIMAELGSPMVMLLCWLCGGIFALCGALCYSELGARFPRAGGEYVFLRESFGRPMAFLSGWISLIVGFSAPIAAAAIAFAAYFFQALAVPVGTGWTYSAAGITLIKITPSTFIAVGVIVLFSLVHYHSLLTGSRVQNGLTLFKIVFILVFIGAGLWFGAGSIEHFGKGLPGRTFSAGQFAVSLIFVSFAYSGWNAAAYLGGEIKNPKKNIPFALVTGTAVVVCLYLMLNIIYVYALPPDWIGGVLEIGATSAVALFGNHVSRLFIGAVCLGLLSVLSAMIMAGPRVYYAMAADGIFFNALGKVNPEHHTPGAAICLQAAIAVIMVLTASFNTLLIYIGFTLSLFAMLTVIGLMRVRAARPPENNEYATPLYPVIPLAFIAGNAWIILFSIKSRPAATLFGLGTIGIGMLIYIYFAGRIKTRASVVCGTGEGESVCRSAGENHG